MSKMFTETRVRVRLLLMLFYTTAVVLFEIFHFRLEGLLPYTDFSFWAEILVYGLVMPAVLIMVLTLTDRRTIERDEAVHSLDQQYEFSQNISQSSSWDKLLDTILKFPETILPSRNTYLHLYDPAGKSYELAGAWGSMTTAANRLASILSENECSCLSNPERRVRTLTTCQSLQNSKGMPQITRYCLPLDHGDVRVGLMHIDLPADMTITHKQVRILNGAAPEIALALNNAGLQRVASNHVETAAKDRQRIARNLHDTLGQDIAYLRFKLDTLSSDISLTNIAEIRKDLESMRDVANQAYKQMRGTLEELLPATSLDLPSAILSRAENAGKRSEFEVHFTSDGQPLEIAPQIEREVRYICREALINVEKHAQASHVDLQMCWGVDDLTIEITDDGIGFDLDECPRRGDSNIHYGLAIMQERAEQVNGRFALSSSPGRGTKVCLWVPLYVSTS